jgi:DNA polymerase III sliding clamp (beta) subunit (PCNA family)
VKLPAAQLKSVLKKLDAVSSDSIWLDTANGFTAAQDASLQIVVLEPALLKSSGEAGCWCLNRKQVASIVSRGAGELNIAFAPSGLTLTTAKSKFELPVLQRSAIILPKAPEESFQISLAPLQELLAYAGMAAEHKQDYMYTGTIQVSWDAKGLTAVGSDGKRLAIGTCESPLGDSKPTTMTLPLPLVAAIRKMDSETIWLGENDNACFASAGTGDSSVTATARKRMGGWPDYQKFIPATFEFCALADARSVQEALDEVEPMASSQNAAGAISAPAVGILFDGGKLILTATASGRAESTAEYEQIDPDPVFFDHVRRSVTINHKYLTDFFRQVSGPVRISMNAPNTPVWLEAGNRKMLVAPIRSGKS